MKIIYATSYFPPFGAGGAERTCSLHAKILASQGHSVAVVTPNYGAAEVENWHGARIFRYPFKHLSGIGKQLSHRYFFLPWVQRAMELEIQKCAESFGAQVIHAQTIYDLVPAFHVAKKMKIPFVSHVRDSTPLCCHGGVCMMEAGVNEPPFRCGLFKNLYCLFGRVRRLKGTSSSLGRMFMSTLGVLWEYSLRIKQWHVYRESDRVAFQSPGLSVLYSKTENFNDISKHRTTFGPAEADDDILEGRVPDDLPPMVRQILERGERYILFVGKVSKGKGADVLFEAHRQLCEKMVGVWLVVAGNCPNKEQWHPVEGKTVFTGFVDRRTVGALYRGCSVVCMPSTWPEPMGWPVQDSGRFEKPIVATNVGGVAGGVKHKETGWLAEKLDSQGVADGLFWLLNSPELLEKVGKANGVWCRQVFGAKNVGEQLESVYEGLLKA